MDWHGWVVAGVVMVVSLIGAVVYLGGPVQLKLAALNSLTERDAKAIRQSLKRELEEHDFISIQRMKEIVTADRVRLQLADRNEQASKEKASNITKDALKLFSILVLLDKHECFEALSKQAVDDTMFTDLKSDGLIHSSKGPIQFPNDGLEGLQGDLWKNQWNLPPPFVEDQTQQFPSEYKPPFYKLSGESKSLGSGGFGDVSKVKVGGGHLQGYPATTVVAIKRIDMRGARGVDRLTILREADTLRARKHPHIIPLLASFTKTDEDDEEHLYLLIPQAIGGDMEKWLTSKATPQCPPSLQSQPTSLPDFLYESIFSIVSALAYVHSEIDEQWTGHWDIKPANILLFEENGVWRWKLADFGKSHLKFIYGASGTHRSLGSFDYQPPEIRISNTKYYTSFDVFPMGGIVVELATMIVFGDWRNNPVKRFRNLRSSNSDPRKESERIVDGSFRNNMHVVRKWIDDLKKQNGSENLQRLLDVALKMMASDERDRLLAFDAALDIWELTHPEEKGLEFKPMCERLIKGQGPNSVKFGKCYDPVLRSKRRPAVLSQERARIRQECLAKVNWPDTSNASQLGEKLTLSKGGKSFSNLPNAFRGDELYGREDELAAVTSSFEQDDAVHVGLYGLGGIGKSHVAWKYVARLRDQTTTTGKMLHTFWVQAQNESVFEACYMEIARKIGIEKEGGESTVTEVQEWLEDPDNGPWVLVLDGMEQIHPKWEPFCPWKAGKILITTKNRAVAVHYCELDSNVVGVGGLSKKDGGKLLQHFSSDPSPQATALASKLYLPILIKTIGQLIYNDKLGGVSIASMDYDIREPIKFADLAAVQEPRRPWSEKLNPDTRTIYGILFQPLEEAYWHCNDAFRLMCFLNKDNIDARILVEEFVPGWHLKIYSDLTNLCYLNSLSKDRYSIHEVLQTMFLKWHSERAGEQELWNGYLRVLGMLANRYQKDKSQQAGISSEPTMPAYLLKLRYKIHVEEFLKYLKLHPEAKGQYSKSSSGPVVTFARMFRDENRFADSEILLSSVLDRGIEDGSPRERLETQHALIETYRASAFGRSKRSILDKALKQVDGATREAIDVKDMDFKRRLRAARIRILCEQQAYEAAKSALAISEAEHTLEQDENHKALLRNLGLHALINRSQGEAECDIELLKTSREGWEKLREETLKSSYSRQEKKESIEDICKEDANTCLAILTVLRLTKSADDSLGEKAFEDASEIYRIIMKERKATYQRENYTYDGHKHIDDAEVNIGTAYLRYGKWKRTKYFADDAKTTFRRILENYRQVHHLNSMDKDVRICAYLLRETLHFLAELTHGESLDAREMAALEEEYNMKPLELAV